MAEFAPELCSTPHSVEAHGVEPHPRGTGPVETEHRDIRDLRHIHQAIARAAADVVEGNRKLAALPRADFQAPVETVRELAPAAFVMYAHAESQYLVTRILDVENELVVFPPGRHRLEEGHARR